MGVENSCEIKASEMNPATLKLCALADIVVKLMGKNRSVYEWDDEILELPRLLERLSLGELLQVCLLSVSLECKLMKQHKTLNQAPCPGELKLLVNLTNKTAYHRVDAYSFRL